MGWYESLRGIHKHFVPGLWIWFFNDRQRSISGACESAVGVCLNAVILVWKRLAVAGVTQQMAIDHRFIYGVIDVRFIFRSGFGEVHVRWPEDIPFGHVYGRSPVPFLIFLFPV